ncbi:MAG: wecE, partial [Neobacillus sp.]|nr:wecE [Neobacillus sp.]
MVKIGSLVRDNDNNMGVVIEVFPSQNCLLLLIKEKATTSTYNEGLSFLELISGKNMNLICDPQHQVTKNINELQLIQQLSNENLESIIRQQILNKVESYYHLFHKKNKKPFNSDQDSLSYGGRVFDEREMKSLVDSSLDFWLTAGRYSKQFEKEFA